MTTGLTALRLSVTLVFAVAATARADTRSDWTTFRQRVPFHSQVIALGEPDAHGRRTVVIAEPPPWVSLNAFVVAFGDRVSGAEAMRHPIGFDGWVKDIAGTATVGSDAELEALVQDLSRFLYGTSYKAYAVSIRNPTDARGKYDLSVSAVALRTWLGVQPSPRAAVIEWLHGLNWLLGIIAGVMLLRTRSRWAFVALISCCLVGYASRATPAAGSAGALRPLHGGDALYLRDLLKHPTSGVYLTEQPGLVALVIGRNQLLNGLTVSLREFALDSDLILGAIGSPAAVVLVGRERQVPVTMLPPLRGETLVQLAAVGKDELSQSYERLNLFAGATPDGDWAPIYLSTELRDTEYGSLLNVTDQLLKGWSEHGEIDYANFPYPKPPTFPFETGLFKAAQTGQVTYNWNTKGVGYTDNSHGYDVVAFGRTGALPVDYLGDTDARMRDFEDRGYDYFAAATGDPNLARVVQYAGIYQVWRHFHVRAEWTPSTRTHAGPDALLSLVRRSLARLRDIAPDGLDRALASATGKRKAALEEFQKMHQVLATLGDDDLASLSAVLVRPRESAAAARAAAGKDERLALVGFAQALSRNPVVRFTVAPLTELARTLYASADSKDDPDCWIKTPSIVLSRNVGAEGDKTVGGHNLSSRVTRTAIDGSLPSGTVRVAEEGGDRVLYYSSADADRMRTAVRSVARSTEEDIGALKGTVEKSLRTASHDTVSMRDALQLASRPQGVARGFYKTPDVRLSPSSGWLRSAEVPSSHATALKALDDGRTLPIVVERTQTGYRVSRPGDAGGLEAVDSAGALDAVVDAANQATGAQVVHLHFIGIDEVQARPFTLAGELHIGRSGSPRVLRASVEGPGHDAIDIVGQVRQGRWNVASSHVEITQQAAGHAIDVQVQLTELSGTRRLVMRLQLEGRRAMTLTQGLIERIHQIVSEVLNAMAAAGQQFDAILAARRIQKRLLEVEPSLGAVKMRLDVEGRAVIITEHVQASSSSQAD